MEYAADLFKDSKTSFFKDFVVSSLRIYSSQPASQLRLDLAIKLRKLSYHRNNASMQEYAKIINIKFSLTNI